MRNGWNRRDRLVSWRRSLLTGLRRLLGFHSWASLPRAFRKAATPGNFRHSFKVGLAAALAYAMAAAAGLEHSLWAPISALIVMQVQTSASLEISLMRLLGAIAGAALGVAAAAATPQEPWGLAAALLAACSACVFLELWEPRFRMAGITAVVVLFWGSMPQASALHLAVSRVLEMGMGIVSALLVSALLWPVSVASQLNAAVRRQFHAAAAALETMTDNFLRGQKSLSPRFLDKLFFDIGESAAVFEKARNYELYHIHQGYPHLVTLIRALDGIRMYLAGMLEALNSDAGEPAALEFADELRDLTEAAAQGLRWIAARPSDEPPPLRRVIEAGTARFSVLRDQGCFRELDRLKVMQVFAFYHSLHHMAQAVDILQARLGCSTASEPAA